MRILIMGLPGSGKTTLARTLSKKLNYRHINADEIRELYNDWDFSMKGRYRQAERMKSISDNIDSICDFVCPTNATRALFDAQYTIWMDTIVHSRYSDTNHIFEQPTTVDVRLENFNYCIDEIVERMKCAKTLMCIDNIT